jgi:4-aminobutyrate aminotransferase-like enzyme
MALGHFTHEKNPVACAAALATLEVIEEEKLADRARELGAHALQTLHAMGVVSACCWASNWQRQPRMDRASRR